MNSRQRRKLRREYIRNPIEYKKKHKLISWTAKKPFVPNNIAIKERS